MKRVMAVLLAAATLAAPAAAQPEDNEALEKRLEDAQRRLEDAAREVAELSGEAAGRDGFRTFDHFIAAPRRAMLGVNLGGAAPNGSGVRVESVSPGGPAAEAGVKPGDVIVGFQSKPVTTGRELVRAMESIEPGQKVELGLRRDGKPLKLMIEARPLDHGFLVNPGMPAVLAMRALPAHGAIPFDSDAHWLLEDWGDAEFVTLTPGLGRYFGAEEGVLVARAPEDTALGLKDGDVIVAIGGREPQNSRHAMRILRSYQPGESVELRILRDRRAQKLSAKVPERRPRDVLHHRLVPPMPPVPPASPALRTPPAPPVPAAAPEAPAST